LNFTPEFLALVLIQYVCLLFSLCVHEAAHAAAADQCGDPSARLLGRLTLNPVKHADIIGTVVFPLMAMLMSIPFLFGWAKPVPFNPINLRNRTRDPVLIAMAGPASNLGLAILFILLLRILVLTQGPGIMDTLPGFFVLSMVGINLILMLFNLLPVPPLDGHYVLNYFLPPRGQEVLAQIGPFGILIAIFLGMRLVSPVFYVLKNGVIHFALNGIGLA
jgi:Zn-dependent protease